jgi:hypothetical protein
MEHIEIDINDVEKFINNPDFHYYLLNNTNEFTTAIFILQVLLDKVAEIKQQPEVDNA